MAKKHRVPVASWPMVPCLHELFEEEAERRPEALAVAYGQQELSYSELNGRANKLAHYLRKLGVKAEARVAICTERGPAMIEAMLAVLKAGGAYVPLDPGYPRERLQFVLEDSQAQVVLKAGARRMFSDGSKVPVLDLGTDETAWAGEAESNLKREETGANPESMAYVIYTSGSTGQPKGVMVEQHSICNRIRVLQSDCGFKAEDRILQFTSITFDVSLEEIFGALLCGAALVLREDSWLRSPEDFLERCRNSKASVLDIPTRFWQSLAESTARIPECARLIIIGGDALEQSGLAAWQKREGYRPKLINCYGPTETTISATLEEMDREGITWRSIGRPIGNTQVYILDERGEPAPVGVMGELYIGGAGVARGYWNRPELTAERFVEDRFAAEGGRMYRTGDLGRWMEGGWIEFLGRNDEQVKIRGYRIELGEIESVLAAHAGVSEAVVIAREEEGGEKRLVAYYTTSGEGKEIAGAEELREHVAAKLPEYMVPAGYVRLEKIPLSAAGKLDRQALPQPGSNAYAMREYEAPQGEVAETLAEIWSELLRLERIGRQDDFFQLGGHSLMAARLVLKIHQHFEVDIDLREMFEFTRLCLLASEIRNRQLAQFDPGELAAVARSMGIS